MADTLNVPLCCNVFDKPKPIYTIKTIEQSGIMVAFIIATEEQKEAETRFTSYINQKKLTTNTKQYPCLYVWHKEDYEFYCKINTELYKAWHTASIAFYNAALLFNKIKSGDDSVKIKLGRSGFSDAVSIKQLEWHQKILAKL